MAKCGKTCEVWARSIGYYRPVRQWNKGKKEEFKDRREFTIPGSGKELHDDQGRQEAGRSLPS